MFRRFPTSLFRPRWKVIGFPALWGGFSGAHRHWWLTQVEALPTYLLGWQRFDILVHDLQEEKQTDPFSPGSGSLCEHLTPMMGWTGTAVGSTVPCESVCGTGIASLCLQMPVTSRWWTQDDAESGSGDDRPRSYTETWSNADGPRSTCISGAF